MVSRGFPSTGDPTAYSRSFELIFGVDHERQRNYLQGILSEKNSSLTLGHRAFAGLIASSLIKIVFTTNFDTVVERALAEVGRELWKTAWLAYGDRDRVGQDEASARGNVGPFGKPIQFARLYKKHEFLILLAMSRKISAISPFITEFVNYNFSGRGKWSKWAKKMP